MPKTLIGLMETKSLQEIRVKDLCEKSGADRHTFYYHFRDKYELVAWIYASGAEESMGGPEGHMGLEESAAALRLVREHKNFYRKRLSRTIPRTPCGGIFRSTTWPCTRTCSKSITV